MKVTFLGGGSLRLLPLIRSVFAQSPSVFRNGEIRLVDRNLDRAEAVGKLIQACPEYENAECRVLWSTDLNSVLPGTDVMYLTMGARHEPSLSQSFFLSNQYGFVSTDNLSVSGAFLSLRLGRTILNIARKMEQFCPNALMLIFPNPVAVYSHLVNTYTRIRALGICGGFNNHRWDLSRLTGQNVYDPQWQVVATGVNHLSFILRGKRNGRDLYSEILPEYLTKDWRPPEIEGTPEAKQIMYQALTWLCRMYHRYGTLVFSTEADGLGHIFCDEYLAWQRQTRGYGESFDPEKAILREQEKLKTSYQVLTEASKSPRTVDWSAKTGLFGRMDRDIVVPLFHALAGLGKMRIVASRPNGSAVKGFGTDVPLEYTMDIFGTQINPVENQYVPEPFMGLISSLAEFQCLQSETIATWNPRIFADALEAYPVGQFTEKRREYYCRMFDIYSDLDLHILEAKKYF